MWRGNPLQYAKIHGNKMHTIWSQSCWNGTRRPRSAYLIMVMKDKGFTCINIMQLLSKYTLNSPFISWRKFVLWCREHLVQHMLHCSLHISKLWHCYFCLGLFSTVSMITVGSWYSDEKETYTVIHIMT